MMKHAFRNIPLSMQKRYDKLYLCGGAPEFFALLNLYHILEKLSITLRKYAQIWQNAKKYDQKFYLQTREMNAFVAYLKYC